MTKKATYTVADALKDALEDEELFGTDGIMPTRLETSASNSRVALITGDNASGKSFFCKFMSKHLREEKVEVIPISMGLRTEAGMQRAFVFRSESEFSTGHSSVQAVQGGLRNATGSGGVRALVLDEPDIGLSEGYAAALGEVIAEFCENVPEDCAGLMIVTHNRAIAAEIAKTDAWRIRIGDDLRSTEEWLHEGPLPVSREKLENLADVGSEKFRAISRLMDSRHATRKEAEEKNTALLISRRDSARQDYLEAARSNDLPDHEREEFALDYIVAALNYFGDDTYNRRYFTHRIEDGKLFVNKVEVGAIDVSLVANGKRTVARFHLDGKRYDVTENGIRDASRETPHLLERAKEAAEQETEAAPPL